MNPNKMSKNLGWKDIQLIKAAVFFITLPIGAYFAEVVLPYWWLLVLLGIAASIKPIKTALK